MPRGQGTLSSLLQRLITKLGVCGSSEQLDAYQKAAHMQATLRMIVRNTALAISERVHRILWSCFLLPLSKLMTRNAAASLQTRNWSSGSSCPNCPGNNDKSPCPQKWNPISAVIARGVT